MLRELHALYRESQVASSSESYISIDPSVLKEFRESSYILPDLPEFLDSLKSCYCIQYGNVKLMFFSPNTSLSRFELFKLRRCAKRAHVLTKFYQKHTTPFEFYVVPHKSLRQFPAEGDIVRPENINGGFTYVSSLETTSLVQIFIFRLEEFPKVMLHEITHHLPFHTPSSKWSPSVINAFYKLFTIDTAGCPHDCTVRLEPNEAIVEFWATIFHLMFLCIESNEISRFEQLLACEQRWSAKQASRLLQLQRKASTPWTEETHSYAYIVLKDLFLQNALAFMQSFRPPYDPWQMLQFLQNAVQKREPPQGSHPPTPTDSMRMTLLGDM
jgi:hypothetical protein